MSITPESSDRAVRVRSRHREERPKNRAAAAVTGVVAAGTLALAVLGTTNPPITGIDTHSAQDALSGLSSTGADRALDSLARAQQQHRTELGTLRINQHTHALQTVRESVETAHATTDDVREQSEQIAERREGERLEAERLEAERLEAEQQEAERREAERREAEQAAARDQERPASPPATPPTGDNRSIARGMLGSYGWGDDQWGCLDALWQRESNWNHTARNPSSGAYGIPQSLPASKMASAGADWETNPATQISWGLGYISGRYGSPCAAWAHSEQHNWY